MNHSHHEEESAVGAEKSPFDPRWRQALGELGMTGEEVAAALEERGGGFVEDDGDLLRHEA